MRMSIAVCAYALWDVVIQSAEMFNTQLKVQSTMQANNETKRTIDDRYNIMRR